MNAITQNEVVIGEDLVALRVEKCKLAEWEGLQDKFNRVNTYTIGTPNSMTFLFKLPEHVIAGSSKNAYDGVAVLGKGSRFNSTGTTNTELIYDSGFSVLPEWVTTVFNNPIGVFSPKGASNPYSELLYVDASDNLTELPKTSIVPVVSLDEFREFTRLGKGSLSDVGNARRLVMLYGDGMRYNKSYNWVIWNGKYWEIDSHKARLYAHNIPRSLFVEKSMIENNKDLADAWEKWAGHSFSSYAITAMLKEAEEMLYAEVDDFSDKRRMLLNVQNGTLNLETGELMPHDPRYCITKIANVSYDPGATCPEWDKFLEMILPDEEIRKFLQIAFGITITGNSDARSIFFMHNGTGDGNNGKSTIVAVMLGMLGEYAKQTDVSILSAPKGGITPYNEDLHNRRFVCTNEIDNDFRLSTATVKNLTGNDRVSCNPKFRKAYDFPPTHTLWIFGNKKPKPVGGGDGAFWGRMKLIPFEVTIPEEIRKPMEQVLPMFKKEFPGILNWCLKGLQMYLKEGLKEPEQVKLAAQSYRAEYDFFGQFVDEECELVEGYKTAKKVLFHAYNDFLQENSASDQGISKKALAQELAKINVAVGGDGKAYYIGIKLRREEQMTKKYNAEKFVQERFEKIT